MKVLAVPVFTAVRGPSLVACMRASLSTGFLGDGFSSRCGAHMGSEAAQGLGCSVASGIFQVQGSALHAPALQGILIHWPTREPTEMIYLINISSSVQLLKSYPTLTP